MAENYKFINYAGAEMAEMFDKIADLDVATQSEAGLMSATDKTKLDELPAGAQANVLEGVQLAGVDLDITEKKVNIPVDNAPTEGSSALIRSGGVFSAGYATKEELSQLGQHIGTLPLFNGGIDGSGNFTDSSARVRTGFLIGTTVIVVNSPYILFKISVFDKKTGLWKNDIDYTRIENRNVTYTNNSDYYILNFAHSSYTPIDTTSPILSSIKNNGYALQCVTIDIYKKKNAYNLYDGGVDGSGNFTDTNLRARTGLMIGKTTISVNTPYYIQKISVFSKETGKWLQDIDYYDKSERNNITYSNYDNCYVICFANSGSPIYASDNIISGLANDGDINISIISTIPQYGNYDTITKNGINQAIDKQRGTSFVVSFITDTHFDEYYGKVNMETFAKVVNSGVATLNIHGGDILSLKNNATKTEVVQKILNQLNVVKQQKPIIFVRGNHDVGYSNSIYISASQFNAVYDSVIDNAVYPAPDVCYFYLDLAKYKTRVFVLDSYNREGGADEDTTPHFGASQLSWLYSTLAATTDGWKVLIFSHSINKDYEAYNIIKAFANKGETYGGYTFSVDLNVSLLAVIRGHLHQDYFDSSDGFLHIGVTRGFSQDQRFYVAFSLFTFNLEYETIYDTRIGDGSNRIFHNDYISLSVGGTYTIQSEMEGTLTFESDNSSIASVTSDGVVTGVAPGRTFIIVRDSVRNKEYINIDVN